MAENKTTKRPGAVDDFQVHATTWFGGSGDVALQFLVSTDLTPFEKADFSAAEDRLVQRFGAALRAAVQRHRRARGLDGPGSQIPRPRKEHDDA